MFAAQSVPAVLFFLLMLTVPESPRWLVKKGAEKNAGAVLRNVGGQDYAQKELSSIRLSLADETNEGSFKVLLEPGIVRILGLGVFLAVFQQWCGINTVFYYAEEIFTAAGYGVSDILLNIVITGSVMLIFTFVAIRRVDRWGRRILMVIGASGLAIVYLLIGLSYHLGIQGLPVLMLVIAAIAIYSFTLAPITWVLISEIFPNRIRGAAVSVAVSALWIGCLSLTYSFPFLNESLGTANTYWLYALICGAGFFVLKKKLPETKGKTLEEIERALLG